VNGLHVSIVKIKGGGFRAAPTFRSELMIKLIKEDKTKILDTDSQLIDVLKADGWSEETKKVEPKKPKKEKVIKNANNRK
jgi:hypothetical protein